MQRKSEAKKEKSEARGYAEVITWGTRFEGGNGLGDQIRAKFSGGNIGHAAIRITLPVDEKSEQLIRENCFEKNHMVLPHTKRQLPSGEEVYEVYISAWSDDKITLDRDFESDSIEERLGVHMEMDAKWEAALRPEQRHYRGLLGGTTMTLSVEQIIHQRGNISAEQYEKLKVIGEFQRYSREIKNFDFLEYRVANTKKLGQTEMLLLEKILPYWKLIVKKPPALSAEERAELVDKINQARKDYKQVNSPSVENLRSTVTIELKQILVDIDNDLKLWGRISPKTAERIYKIAHVIDDERMGNSDKVSAIAKIDACTPDDIEKLKAKIREAALSPDENKLIRQFENYMPDDKKLISDSYSFGLPPDHIVRIPIDSLDKPRKDGSLNVEAMLKRAKTVATSGEKFSLTSANCSSVASWVLEAGASDKRGDVFKKRALKILATPQMVFNNASRYLAGISPKAKQNYDAEVASRLQTSESQVQPEIQVQLPDMKEIKRSRTQSDALTRDECESLMSEFERVLKDGEKIPYYSNRTKLSIEAFIKDDAELQARFVKLCDAALKKVNEQGRADLQTRKGEWGIVKGLVKPDTPEGKISKKNHGNLRYSYLVAVIDGEKKILRLNKKVLGKGAEGYVKLLEDEHGNRYAVKILENKESLNRELRLMKKAGASKADIIRHRTAKQSKQMSKKIGDKRYVIQPFLSGADLTGVTRRVAMSYEQRLQLAKKCCEAVVELHKKGIIHRDLKPSNFIAEFDGAGNVVKVSVIDFGGAIKQRSRGYVRDTLFGSPLYMAPETHREAILAAAEKTVEIKKDIAMIGKKIADASDNIERLQSSLRETRDRLSYLETMMLNPENKRENCFKDGVTQRQVNALLSRINGSNDEEVRQELMKLVKPDDGSRESVRVSLNQYFLLIKRDQQFVDSINVYTGKMRELSQDLTQKKQDLFAVDKSLSDLFKQEVKQTTAVDIYALGVMFENEFGLDLTACGLEKMKAENPGERSGIESVLNTLDDRIVKQHQIDLDQRERKKALQLATEIPSLVDVNTLHESPDGLLSSLTADEMRRLDGIRHENSNNRYLLLGNKTVFLTKEGGAFVMYGPLGTKSNANIFLVQNVDDQSWCVMKMIQGLDYKIRGSRSQLMNENVILNDMDILKGTLEMTIQTQEMHISIQPYVYGKDYSNTVENAQAEGGQPLSPEMSVLMSVKALEALFELNEKGYIHRDIKLQNLMWDPNKKVCTLVDFGCAKKGEGEAISYPDTSKVGTALYAAPEIDFKRMSKNDRVYNVKTDMYAMGVVIGQLLEITNPKTGDAYQQLKDLQAKMTDADPNNRPSTKEAYHQLMIIAQTLAVQGKLDQQDILPRTPQKTKTATVQTLSETLSGSSHSKSKGSRDQVISNPKQLSVATIKSPTNDREIALQDTKSFTKP